MYCVVVCGSMRVIGCLFRTCVDMGYLPTNDLAISGYGVPIPPDGLKPTMPTNVLKCVKCLEIEMTVSKL